MTMRVEGIDSAIELVDDVTARTRDLRPVLEVIAEDLKFMVDEAFETSTSPKGQPWAPLKAARQHGRDRGAPKPLIDTGRLRNSISANARPDGVQIGTNVLYAGTHQFGSVNVPARPFLPATYGGEWAGPEGELDRIADMIAAYIETGEITG